MLLTILSQNCLTSAVFNFLIPASLASVDTSERNMLAVQGCTGGGGGGGAAPKVEIAGLFGKCIKKKF